MNTITQKQPMTVDLKSFVRPFFYLAAAIQVADGTSTYLALTFKTQEGLTEGNPVGVAAINLVGVLGFCVLKSILGVLLASRLAYVAENGIQAKWLRRNIIRGGYRSIKSTEVAAVYVMAFSILVTALVVGNNLRALFIH